MKRVTIEKPVYHCIDCAHGTFDMKFDNLDLNGQPTLIACPFERWKRLFNDPICKRFKKKA